MVESGEDWWIDEVGVADAMESVKLVLDIVTVPFEVEVEVEVEVTESDFELAEGVLLVSVSRVV